MAAVRLSCVQIVTTSSNGIIRLAASGISIQMARPEVFHPKLGRFSFRSDLARGGSGRVFISD